MSLLLSYKLGVTTQETVGINQFNSKENLETLVVQSNNNTLENAKPFKLAYALGAGAIKTILLSDLNIRFLTLICIEANNIIKYIKGLNTVEGSLILVTNKVPTILPLTVSEDSIIIENISSEIVNLTIALVGIV
jgi:hypothetical protein